MEFVPKFQAVQAAHEVLSDPQEKVRYDTGRAKQNRASAPPPPRDDPYNFRKPQRPASSTNFPPPPKGPAPGPRPTTYGAPPRTPASAGAEKFNAFTRGADTWDRRKFEEAAKADAARKFPAMRGEQSYQMPPRRPHPTAPRPTSAETYDNAPNPGFPGMSRAANSRRPPYAEQPSQSTRSAYSYVRGNRPPPSTAQSYQDAFANAQSPPAAHARPVGASPLRHAKSTEQTNKPQRPGLFTRESSRYASSHGERTDLHDPGLRRSASVRNSPIDKQYTDTGPFGKSQTYSGPPRRHRSESPTARAQSHSSESSNDETLHTRNGHTNPAPRPRRTATNDGLEGSFPSTNYTKVTDPDNNTYAYPPPPSRGPVREPFPNMTSPDEPTSQDPTSFRYALYRSAGRSPCSINGLPSWIVPSTVSITQTDLSSNGGPKHDPVFQAAKFSHEDWAERLKSTSPVKRGSKSKRPPVSKSVSLADQDAMDIDPSEPEPPRTSGLQVDDLANEAPFKSEGLNGVDDLTQNLPFQSRAAKTADVERAPLFRLNLSDLPPRPRPVTGPPEDQLTQENWTRYLQSMRTYMKEWSTFEGKMMDHFRARQEQVSRCMADNWMSMAGDGPSSGQVDSSSDRSDLVNSDGDRGKVKAGYHAYMDWLDQDEQLHAFWDTTFEVHREVMEKLGRLRRVIQGTPQDSSN